MLFLSHSGFFNKEKDYFVTIVVIGIISADKVMNIKDQ